MPKLYQIETINDNEVIESGLSENEVESLLETLDFQGKSVHDEYVVVEMECESCHGERVVEYITNCGHTGHDEPIYDMVDCPMCSSIIID